jgi:hypothetical protein
MAKRDPPKWVPAQLAVQNLSFISTSMAFLSGAMCWIRDARAEEGWPVIDPATQSLQGLGATYKLEEDAATQGDYGCGGTLRPRP